MAKNPKSTSGPARFEIRKRADKTGPEPGRDSAGKLLPGQAYPLSCVDLVTDLADAPKEWTFSEPFVADGVREGWITFEGSPIKFAAHADPLGKMASLGEVELSTPGSVIVLHLQKDDKPIKVRYRITDSPVPIGFRVMDSTDPNELRAPHAYTVELVK